MLSLIAVLLLSLLVAGCGQSPPPGGAKAEATSPPGRGAPKEEEVKVPKGLLIVERDVSQTRTDFAPVINHEAMIVNTSGAPAKLDIASSFAKSRHVVTKFYPAFGKDSLLAEPMRVPAQVKVGKYRVLEKPSLAIDAQDAVFSWKGVSVPDGDAAIAQYDQYAGPLSQYYKPEGLRALDLLVGVSPKIEKAGRDTVLRFRVHLQNQAKAQFEQFHFDFFVPDTVFSLDGTRQTALLTEATAWASKAVTYENAGVGDGRGRAASGTLFRYSKETFAPGEQIDLEMGVKGKAAGAAEVCHPLITLLGLSRGERIWPETKVTSFPSLPAARFYYRQANLILPSPVLVRFESKGIRAERFEPSSRPPK